MKRHLILLLISFLSASALLAQEPYFRLKDLSNQWKEYGDLKGEQLTVIDFWASWCQPCVQSIPHLNQMAEEYADQGVTFIGVSVDGPRSQSKLAPFIKSMGVTYPILRDINSELMSELGVTAVPTLLIYDASGEMVHLHEGYRPGDEVSIASEIASLLE